MTRAWHLYPWIVQAFLASIRDSTDYYKNEIDRLRLIVRDAAVTAELWLRSKHATERFFLITPDSQVGIDREGKPVLPGSGPTLV